MNQRLEGGVKRQEGPLPKAFAVLFGAFLGLAPIKFGNPPIMEKWVTSPTNVYEFLLGSPWPIGWAYSLLALLVIVGSVVARRRFKGPLWLVVLPVAWLLWECLASAWTLDPGVTRPTLAHFAACTACFYLGFFSLIDVRHLASFWAGLLCSLLIVVAVGWEQHFGGLEQTRQYFFAYIYPRLKEIPPGYLKKISSTRIFSTLFYPNALAGALLLLLPASLAVVWQLRERFTFGARLFLLIGLGSTALACLYWSGSKGGWLLMLILGLLWLLRLPFTHTARRNLILVVLVVGLAGFFYKYSGFFQRGATSVSARFDYWQAALRTVRTHPLLGTGPGTFSIAYQRVKRPESEASRLVHNDYLEQASDSGVPGFVLYTAFVISALILTFPPWPAYDKLWSWRDAFQSNVPEPKQPKSATSKPPSIIPSPERQIEFGLWIGVLGWALQSSLEFSLYIPGLAWPAFAVMGLLLRRRCESPADDVSLKEY